MSGFFNFIKLEIFVTIDSHPSNNKQNGTEVSPKFELKYTYKKKLLNFL